MSANLYAMAAGIAGIVLGWAGHAWYVRKGRAELIEAKAKVEELRADIRRATGRDS